MLQHMLWKLLSLSLPLRSKKVERREECASPGTMVTFSHFSICGFSRYSFKSVSSFFLRFSNVFSVPHVCSDHFVEELANAQWSCSSPQHPWNGDFPVPLHSPSDTFLSLLFSLCASLFSLPPFSVCWCFPVVCFPSGGQKGGQRGATRRKGCRTRSCGTQCGVGW